MIFRARHIQEDRLFECYLAEQGGEPLEPPAAEHLADCGECRTRFADLRRFMDGLRSEADAGLDEIFPPERWHAQQQQIARRIELLAHPGRIISFPGQAAARPAARSAPRVAPRWLGAAAAAGLVIGAGAGSLIYSGVPGSGPASFQAASVAPVESVMIPTGGDATVAVVPTDINDQFLSELELALERPHTRELVAIDELTPHVREIRAQLR